MAKNKYLDSERISSYPSTKRASVNKLITENSVTRTINRLIDKESYVITNGLASVDFTSDIPKDIWTQSQADFEFVIHGYYFCITRGDGAASGLDYLLNQVKKDPELPDNEPQTLYARIFIDKIDPAYPELYGQEDLASTYQAISFYWNNEPIVYPDGVESNYKYYDAPLVKYMADDKGTTFGYFVPLTSIFRFGSQAIENIDGGEIIL